MTWTEQRGTELPPGWAKLRLAVLERDGWVCRINDSVRCIVNATDCDHIEDREDHSPSNLRAACRPCRAHRSAMQGVAARPTGRRAPEQHPADRRAATRR